MFRRLNRKISNFVQSRAKKRLLCNFFDDGLPKEMGPVLNYLVFGKSDFATDSVITLAENRRREIASKGDMTIPIWYSPKPGSSEGASSIAARPKPGKVLEFTMARIAATGKNQKWGAALYLIAREFGTSVGLELGTCAGISAIYLSSAPEVTKLITVEGSEALTDIARESLENCKNAQVVNALFDEAIDTAVTSVGLMIDLVYIDGHHEKVATIHYFNRLIPNLNPGAVVIFDDISWSYDMREAWNILSKRSEFAHSMDLGVIGVCVMKKGADSAKSESRYWDFQPIVGKQQIGVPHGWVD